MNQTLSADSAGDSDLPDRPSGSAGSRSVAGHPLASGGQARSIGPYRLLEKIGEGGFGEVWRAQQDEPVRRQVALKIIKPGMDSRQVVARFEAERQALAMMDHPNIAKILDAGTTESVIESGPVSEALSAGPVNPPPPGRPFFVMELVRGSRITDHCDQQQLSVPDRLRLFILVCNAVQHAHQKGIIHRDLKPSNILVTQPEGALSTGVPKVIDFGIAKAMEQDLTDKTFFTQFAQFVGTPAYVSPEQAESRTGDIDTRSDIYSLGVLLYELLVGRTPFDAATLVQGGLDSLRRTIRDEEPVKPSTRLKALTAEERTSTAERRRSEPVRLGHELRGDLDWIVLKCLEKDRSRRYETANGLAMDLQRCLANEPVVARPPSNAYRIWKTWKRNKVLFGAGFTVTLALVVATGVSTWQAARATRSRNAAESLLYAANMNLMGQAWAANDPGRVRQLLEQTADFPGRGFEWLYWQRQVHQEVLTFRGHVGRVWAADFSPDGARVVTASDDKTAKVWEVATGRVEFTLGGHGDWVRSAAFSPDGRWIVTGSKDFTARVWDAATGLEVRRLLGHRAAIRTVAFSADGRRVVTACQDGTARTWETDSGRSLVSFVGHSNWLFSAVFSPDGRRIATSGDDGTARVWDAADGRELRRLEGHRGNVRTVAFSPDGRQVVTAGQDRTARIWEVENGSPGQILSGHLANVFSAAYSPDGRHVVTTSGDQTARIWEVANGREVNQFKGHGSEVYTAIFSRDGRRVLTASEDNTSRIWDVPSLTSDQPAERDRNVLDYGKIVYTVAISLDSRQIALGGQGGTIKVWSAVSGDLLQSWPSHETEVRSLAFSPDGRHLAAGHGDGSVRIWEPSLGRQVRVFEGHVGGVNTVVFSPDGSRILTAGGEGRIKVRRAEDGRELLSIPPKHREAHSASFSPDGRRIVGGFETVVMVWQADTGAEILTLPNTSLARSARFSPDGRWILAAGTDKTARLWDAIEGDPRLALTGHARAVYAASFSPDGKRIVTAGQDGFARVWETASGRELLNLRGHTAEVTSAVFSPDGRSLVTGSLDGTARVWSAEPRGQAAPRRVRDPKASNPPSFSLSGPTLVDGSTPPPPGLIARWLLLAPFPVSSGDPLQALDAEQLPGEALLHPRARDHVEADGRSYVWEPLNQASLLMDLNSLVGKISSPNSVGYTVCYLVNETPRPGVTLKVVSDDECKVYLNGKVVHRSNPQRNYVLEEESVDGLELPAGTNTLVLKIVNRIEYWRASLRMVDDQGQEIPGVRVTLEPPP